MEVPTCYVGENARSERGTEERHEEDGSSKWRQRQEWDRGRTGESGKRVRERERRRARRREGKDERGRSGEPRREQRHPRAHFRFGAVDGDEKRDGGGALTREILIPC